MHLQDFYLLAISLSSNFKTYKIMSITSQSDVMGGGAGYGFGGGFGGISPVGIIGLNTLFGRGGFGGDGAFPGGGGFNNLAGNTVAEQNISELRKDVAGVNTTVEALGNEIQGRLAMQDLSQAGEFRNLDNRLCDSEKTALASAYAASLQAFQNTQAIQNQMTAFQISTDKEFCSVKGQIVSDGDKTRALINSIEMQNLRDALELERRGRSNREIEINISNTNQQTQNQLQAQLQTQSQLFANSLNLLGDQISRQTNSIINLGGTVAAGQTNTNANTKVNS